MKLRLLASLVGLCLVACGSKDAHEKSSAEETSSKKAAAPSGSASASAAPAGPTAPASVLAVRAGKLLHPATKEELKLVETPLSKCFGFKGYSMMLPEGVMIETVSGARACAAFLPTPKKKFGFLVMTDEIKVKMWKRTDLENVKKKPLDEPDAFVFEVEEKGKAKLSGWTDGTVGPHRVQCNSMRDEGTMTLDDELAFIEVCRTLKYAEPEKK